MLQCLLESFWRIVTIVSQSVSFFSKAVHAARPKGVENSTKARKAKQMRLKKTKSLSETVWKCDTKRNICRTCQRVFGFCFHSTKRNRIFCWGMDSFSASSTRLLVRLAKYSPCSWQKNVCSALSWYRHFEQVYQPSKKNPWTSHLNHRLNWCGIAELSEPMAETRPPFAQEKRIPSGSASYIHNLWFPSFPWKRKCLLTALSELREVP